MTAAERQLPNPGSSPTWLSLAQNVFNTQVARWDTSTCGGGLRWQIFTFNAGYNYKNSISTGAFFQLAARLARYTRNQTYVDWANKSWAWANQVSLLDENYSVFDGTITDTNCSQIDHIRWSYSAGTFLAGSAYMFNFVSRPPYSPIITEISRPMATPSGRTGLSPYSPQCLSSSPVRAVSTPRYPPHHLAFCTNLPAKPMTPVTSTRNSIKVLRPASLLQPSKSRLLPPAILLLFCKLRRKAQRSSVLVAITAPSVGINGRKIRGMGKAGLESRWMLWMSCKRVWC